MEHDNWQKEIQQANKDPYSLLKEFGLTLLNKKISTRAADAFPMRIPRGFAAQIRKNNPDDPLLRQVLPVKSEEQITPGFSHDPLAEKNYQPIPGILHKYHGRVLLTVTGACAIHCRYCFRRYFPYSDSNPFTQSMQKVIDYLQKDTTIREIILSGGDPLTLSDKRLNELVTKLTEIPHIIRLRIHTRIPIVLPERIGDSLLKCLTDTRLQSVVVVHANHANEISQSVCDAIGKMKECQLALFNQSVLLKGVNDSVEILIELSEKLFSIGVIPYYLHMLDPVQGTAHFRVSDQKARRLISGVRKHLPGYLVPRLVRELPGQDSKIPVELRFT